jgi:hypothetical protein
MGAILEEGGGEGCKSAIREFRNEETEDSDKIYV